MGEPTTQRIPWWPLPVLMAASFLVFWSVLALTPFSDDHSAVWNAGVRGIPWRNGFFRPLADLSFRLGDALVGTSAVGHRSFNVALHGLNAFLLFTLWFRTAIKLDPHERLVGAIIAGVLFLLYPFHLESIVWLVGREASLGTCFVLLGLWVAGSSLAIPYRMLGLGFLFYSAACATKVRCSYCPWPYSLLGGVPCSTGQPTRGRCYSRC